MQLHHAVALVSLAIYSISKNNEISELKAWKIVSFRDTQSALQITKGELKYIEENNKNKDKDGKDIDGEYRVYFTNQKGEEGYVVATSLLLPINLKGEKAAILEPVFKLKNELICEA
ncbi:hypothetical protein [Wolbachia endosymbiont (group A) of Colletes cunicularius]|uniref:hypothetical protein n=1 Tax=Wolbachia endosymbiont (group A) of Colletes cunicularius TaxID=3139321 RepID=UPI0035C94212